MKLSTFIEASKACKMPPGNYILKSKQTGTLFWFMVGSDLDKTLKYRFEVGSKQYGEFALYRSLHKNLPWERKAMKDLYTAARLIIKRRKA